MLGGGAQSLRNCLRRRGAAGAPGAAETAFSENIAFGYIIDLLLASYALSYPPRR